MSTRWLACAWVIWLALAACAAPPTPTLLPATAGPNGVQTGQALLTTSYASLTPHRQPEVCPARPPMQDSDPKNP